MKKKLIQHTKAHFEKVFQESPEHIFLSPGRINIIGEHIDYSEGFVLPFAIADRTFAAIARNNDGLVRIASQQRKNRIFTIDIKDVQPGSAGEWEKYVLGVIWTMGITSGVDILVDGHVPSGAGLSSSAALECSVAVGLNTLFSLGKSLGYGSCDSESRKRLCWHAVRNHGSISLADGP